VVDGVTGVLVDPTDAVAVADAVSDLLLDRPRARALGRAGGVRAEESSWTRMARQVERLVSERGNEAMIFFLKISARARNTGCPLWVNRTASASISAF
jgi:hypothetical protein